MLAIAEALALGFGFGFLLHKAGLTHYARIVNVYRLRDLTVMRFMLAALLVGAIAIQAALGLGLTAAVPLPGTFVVANLVGGVVFGIGLATAGDFPGHLGLRSMAERAEKSGGRLEITSQPGVGTRVTATFAQ